MAAMSSLSAWAMTTMCAVLFIGDDGVLAGMTKGSILVDHTTASADLAA